MKILFDGIPLDKMSVPRTKPLARGLGFTGSMWRYGLAVLSSMRMLHRRRMSMSDIYRQNAARERLLAAKANLQNRKAMHERSAAIWDEMAVNAEATADRAIVNAAAKVTA